MKQHQINLYLSIVIIYEARHGKYQSGITPVQHTENILCPLFFHCGREMRKRNTSPYDLKCPHPDWTLGSKNLRIDAMEDYNCFE